VRSLLAGKQGLTLAEVLAALAVLSVGLVATISLLPLAGLGVHEGEHRSAAVFLAGQRLEQIRLAVGTAGASNDPLTQVATVFPDEPTMGDPYAAFGRSVRVQDCALGCSGTLTPGLHQVTVQVTYPGRAAEGSAPAEPRAVVLSTYLGSR
jgi:prepilin-type N-terminal cleavage/methylation domain-containing protein